MKENYYYSKNPDVKHEEKNFDFRLLGVDFKFVTDNGVFSKNTIDFGSRVLIEAAGSLELGDKILDVGCGYGPIGLSLAKKNPGAMVEMVDVNELALELAKKNATKNAIKNVSIHESSIYENVEETDFSTIVTNPPIRAGKEVVHGILLSGIDHLKEGGMILAVLQKKQGAHSAMKKMEETYGNCETIAKEKGYYVLKSVKE